MRSRVSRLLFSVGAIMSVLLAAMPVNAQMPGPMLLRFSESALIAHEHITALYQIDSIEIRNLPLREITDVVTLLPGTVIDRRNGLLHIRGGSAYANEFTVDGVPMTNGYSGLTRFVLGQDAIGSVSLDTRRQHSFAAPEIVATQTPGLAERLHGSVEAVTDNFHGDKEDYNIYSGSVSGPLAWGHDRLTFDASIERRWYNGGRWNWFGSVRYASPDATAMIGTTGLNADWRTYPRAYLFDYAHAPRQTLKDNSVYGTAAFGNPSRAHVNIYADWHRTQGKRGDGVYFDNLWGYGRPGDGNPQADETDLFYSWDDLYIDGNGERIVTPTYDSVLTVPTWFDQNMNGEVDEGEPFYLDGEPRDIAFTYNFTRLDSIVDNTEYTTHFADEGHVWDDYSAYEWSSIGGRVEAGERGELMALPMMVQAEFDVRRHTIRSYKSYFPTRIYMGAAGGFNDINSFGYDALGSTVDEDDLNGAKHPLDLGGYIGGEARLHDLSLSGGVRINQFDYDAMALRDPENPLDPDGYSDPRITPDPTQEQLLAAQHLDESDLTDAETYTRYSPRIRADLQLGRNTATHLGLQRSYHRPPLEALYVNFDYLEYKLRTGGYAVTLGNAALEPMSTLLYEAGITQRVNDRFAFSVTGFYKDIEHILDVVNQPAMPTTYTTFVPNGVATAQGIEVRAVKQASPVRGGFALDVSYTLQKVEGSTLPDAQGNVAWSGSNGGARDTPLNYDRRHTLAAVVGYRTGKGRAGMSVLDNLDAFAVFRAESGFPYTATDFYNAVTLGNVNPVPAGAINDSRMPAVYRLDLQITKRVSIQRMNVDVFLWVINVFDRDNPIDVYTATGDADNTGWLETPAGNFFLQNNPVATDVSGLDGEGKYRLRENDPSYFDLPRQIRLGARIVF